MSKRRSEQEILESINPVAIFVRKKRKALGLTQEIFARRCGVGLAFLRRLESGDENLQLSKVLQVVRYLGAELIPNEANDA